MKIINNLVVKSLKENKTRTLTTIIGTTLAFTLMFLIAFGISSLRKSVLNQIIASAGSYHYEISDVKDTQSKLITENNDIKSYIVFNRETIKDDLSNKYYFLTSYKADYEDNITLYKGSYPKDGEVIISRFIYDSWSINIGDYINSYKVVGIYNDCKLINFRTEKNYYYGAKLNYIITNYTESEYSSYYITYKNVVGSHRKVNTLARQLGFNRLLGSGGVVTYENIKYNDQLLELYGEYAESGAGAMFKLVLIITLSVISLVTFFILTNSFSISVKERIKQFGILSSIGTTRKQIVVMVLLEGLYIGFISIIIALVLSILLLMQVLGITNYLLQHIISSKYLISIYLPYLFIALGYGMLTLFLAVLSPARKISRVSPIESIQGNTTFNSRKRRFKSNSKIAKIFKIEGILASKNTKRNASKYKVIIITISISILLYLFFTAIINLNKENIESTFEQEKYDFSISGVNENDISLFRSVKGIGDIDIVKNIFVSYKKPDDNKYYSLENNTSFDTAYTDKIENTVIYQVTEDEFNSYIKEYNLNKNYPIIINNKSLYDDDFKVIGTEPIYKNEGKFNINFCNYEYILGSDTKVSSSKITNCYLEYKDVNLINDGWKQIGESSNNGAIIVTKEMFDKILDGCTNEICLNYKKNPTVSIYINADDDIYDIDERLQTIVDNMNGSNVNYNSPAVYYLNAKMMIIALKFIIYVILTLIILICITFMINTIASSLMLRKNEFAVLKSIGMTNKSVKKMVFLESIGVGFKALILGIILSYASIYLFFAAINSNTNDPIKYDYPIKETFYMAIVIVIFNVIIYMYMMNRINKDNIIDDIRNTNI